MDEQNFNQLKLSDNLIIDKIKKFEVSKLKFKKNRNFYTLSQYS